MSQRRILLLPIVATLITIGVRADGTTRLGWADKYYVGSMFVSLDSSNQARRFQTS